MGDGETGTLRLEFEIPPSEVQLSPSKAQTFSFPGSSLGKRKFEAPPHEEEAEPHSFHHHAEHGNEKKVKKSPCPNSLLPPTKCKRLKNINFIFRLFVSYLP